MANIILGIGSEEDPHIQEVSKHVKSLDSEARVVLFNPLCGGHFIEITAGNVSERSPSCLVVVDGERIPADAIKSVWYRWKPAFLSADEDLQGRILRVMFKFLSVILCLLLKIIPCQKCSLPISAITLHQERLKVREKTQVY